MTDPIDPNNSGLQRNDELSGYRIQDIISLKEMDGTFYQLIHSATGARHGGGPPGGDH